MKFTAKQLKDWKAYERVRTSGRFNMNDIAALEETLLSRKQYMFVMQNYSELREAFLIEAEKSKANG